MARQLVGEKKLRRWSREFGIEFERGLHRANWVSLRTPDHRHFQLNTLTRELVEESDPIHWTTCPKGD